MELSGRDQWQPVANAPTSKSAETNRGRVHLVAPSCQSQRNGPSVEANATGFRSTSSRSCQILRPTSEGEFEKPREFRRLHSLLQQIPLSENLSGTWNKCCQVLHYVTSCFMHVSGV
jgi:hypothetical protein